MMFSISEPSQEKYEEVAGGIIAAVSGKDAAQAKPFSTMLRQMQQTTTTMEISEKTEVKSTQKGVTFDFKSQGMFKPGSA